MFGRDPVNIQKAHLLGLLVGNRRALRQRIQIVVAQALTAAALGAGLLQRGARLLTAPIGLVSPRIDSGGRAGNQQRLGIAVRCAAGVRQGHPALHIDLGCTLIVERDIIRPPAQTGREVAQSGGTRSGVTAADGHRQSRLRAQVVRHFVENDPDRQPIVPQYFDALADFQDDAAVRGENLGLLAGFGAVGRIHPDDRDFLPDRLFHQFARGQQIEIEVLLDDPDVGGRQRHRLRPDLRGNVLEFDPLAAALDLDVPMILHQGQIVGIDGDRQCPVIGLGGRFREQRQSRCHQKKTCTHETPPVIVSSGQCDQHEPESHPPVTPKHTVIGTSTRADSSRGRGREPPSGISPDIRRNAKHGRGLCKSDRIHPWSDRRAQ